MKMMRIIATWIARSPVLRLLALVLSYAISLFIIQRGLLAKRQVLPHRSSCSDVVTGSPSHCWTRRPYNRSILLVIDALRFDFISPIWNDFNQATISNYYNGQMPKISLLLDEKNENGVYSGKSAAALFPFIADAPTTTYQRIKALVTGSVPAFIEAGDNFGGSEISEDNIVDQLLTNGHNVTLIGDETWLQLLPGRFHRHFEEPSFDIKDLDTVDNTVIARIYEEMARSDWTLLIAHCLGVDHAGHRYGPDHPEMRRKLQQMDQLIWNVTKQMLDDTILFVIGDHGMTLTGDHGGDSALELESALFAYARPRRGRDDFVAEDQSSFKSTTREKMSFNQVDLVPTLALMLDIPIPFSNIGHFIGPLFHGNLLRESRLNLFQMVRYAEEYVKSRSQLRDQLNNINRLLESSPDDLKTNERAILAIEKLIRSTLDQFHPTLCLLGILFLLEALLFNCYLLATGYDHWISHSLWMFRSALLLLQLSLVFAQQPTVDQILFSAVSLAVAFVYQILVLAGRFLFLIHNCPFDLLLILMGQILLSALPFSNSFIIYEADVLRFAIQTVFLFLIFRIAYVHRMTSFSISRRPLPREYFELAAAIVGMAIIRYLKSEESCREEQVNCQFTQYSHEILFFRFGFIISFVVWSLMDQLEKRGGGIPVWTRLVVRLTAILLWFHWLFEISIAAMANDGQKSQQFIVNIRPDPGAQLVLELLVRVLAQSIFAISIVFCLVYRWLPIESKYSIRCWVYSQLFIFCIPLMMLNGYSHGPLIALFVLIFLITDKLFQNGDEYTFAFLLNLIGSYAFYATGHQQTLSSIPWKAAFIGLSGNFPYKWLPGFLVLCNMFSGKMLAALVALTRTQAPLYLILFGGLKVFGCSLASILHNKHLMFYKVFAPKFVFESVEFLFSCAIVIIWMLLEVRQRNIK